MSRTGWFLALASSALAGVAFGVADASGSWLPARMGYVVAGLSLLGGLVFGLKAIWLPFAGIAAFGLTAFVAATVSPAQGEDQRALVVLFVTVLPALYMLPALVGAGVRWLLRRRSGSAA